MLGCVIYPSYGDLWVDRKHINELKENQLARLRLETIGFVFQSFNLLAPLSAEDNVELPLKLLGVGTSERKQRVQKALETVGIGVVGSIGWVFGTISATGSSVPRDHGTRQARVTNGNCRPALDRRRCSRDWCTEPSDHPG